MDLTNTATISISSNYNDRTHPIHGKRSFYSIPDNEIQKTKCRSKFHYQKSTDDDEDDSARRLQQSNKLCSYIEENIVGNGSCFIGPFGERQIVYCDYIASGKSLRFIEDYIRSQVLPMYGNTHTTTTVTSLQTTLYRHEARDIIRNACNASEYDAVIFAGSGVTGAVHKLIGAMDLGNRKTVVFLGPFEHHSSLLPWREAGATIVYIPENCEGTLDIKELTNKLIEYKSSGFLIGCFNAASNITGILENVNEVTACCHSNGCLALWDYATAGPYVPIDMNPVDPCRSDHSLVSKDAVFISPHKFIGGVETPGVLIAKRNLLTNGVPHCGGGGGSVFFVTQDSHRYLQEVENREEPGTPAIVGSIRAGLAFQLKHNVDPEFIKARELSLARRALEVLSTNQNVVILGSQTTQRLPVMSFLVYHQQSGYFLHYNYICALLNDLFGVQTRGGCACAGPYAQSLLGLDEPTARLYEQLLLEDSRLDRTHLRRRTEFSDKEVLRPGFVRFNLSYFMSDPTVEYILDAVCFVAEHAWRFLPWYTFIAETGEWRHRKHRVFTDRKWLGSISYSNGAMVFPDAAPQPTSCHPGVSPSLPNTFPDVLATASHILNLITSDRQCLPDQRLMFEDCLDLRWFLLPSEAYLYVRGEGAGVGRSVNQLPYIPRGMTAVRQCYPLSKPLEHKEHMTDSQNLVDNMTHSQDLKDNNSQVENGALECVQDGYLLSPQILTDSRFHHPPRPLFKSMIEAINEFGMISDGDNVLLALSGGKDSLSLLHALKQYQYVSRSKGVRFRMGAVTVDPQAQSYDPSPLIPYMQALGVPYHYERQDIIGQARDTEPVSICSFCSRLKRGKMYACARRHGYNVLALGQHLDDIAESFFMSVFHNGLLRTMKANYPESGGHLRVIRPLVYVREIETRRFAESANLPVIPENCPACFEAPKERHRIKQLLAAQELMFPDLFFSLKLSLKPLLARGCKGSSADDGVVNDHLTNTFSKLL